jgi:hypothetical protein
MASLVRVKLATMAFQTVTPQRMLAERIVRWPLVGTEFRMLVKPATILESQRLAIRTAPQLPAETAQSIRPQANNATMATASTMTLVEIIVP